MTQKLAPFWLRTGRRIAILSAIQACCDCPSWRAGPGASAHGNPVHRAGLASAPQPRHKEEIMTATKIQNTHCERIAFVYVRQSTPLQVIENRESTERQYHLRDRAIELGWPPSRVEVIDEDQGRSGSSAAHRSGFQRLASEVGLGKVGIVFMLEASRLARNNSDWYRLIEICGVSGTLIADESAVYNPREPNDRLLLGVNRPDSQSTSYSTSR